MSLTLPSNELISKRFIDLGNKYVFGSLLVVVFVGSILLMYGLSRLIHSDSPEYDETSQPYYSFGMSDYGKEDEVECPIKVTFDGRYEIECPSPQVTVKHVNVKSRLEPLIEIIKAVPVDPAALNHADISNVYNIGRADRGSED
jgi:hypothetical protein